MIYRRNDVRVAFVALLALGGILGSVHFLVPMISGSRTKSGDTSTPSSGAGVDPAVLLRWRAARSYYALLEIADRDIRVQGADASRTEDVFGRLGEPDDRIDHPAEGVVEWVYAARRAPDRRMYLSLAFHREALVSMAWKEGGGAGVRASGSTGAGAAGRNEELSGVR